MLKGKRQGTGTKRFGVAWRFKADTEAKATDYDHHHANTNANAILIAGLRLRHPTQPFLALVPATSRPHAMCHPIASHQLTGQRRG